METIDHGAMSPSCWVCQSHLSTRAAFCHDCGTIQPPHDVDHFARLGLEGRYDLDLKQLEKHYLAMQRIFKRQVETAKGARQATLAGEHLQALDTAYFTLGEARRRAQYMLSLYDTMRGVRAAIPLSDDLETLQKQLDTAPDAFAIDRVAYQAGRGMEQAIFGLAKAFREESFETATVLLARLTQLEDIATTARERRVALSEANEEA